MEAGVKQWWKEISTVNAFSKWFPWPWREPQGFGRVREGWCRVDREPPCARRKLCPVAFLRHFNINPVLEGCVFSTLTNRLDCHVFRQKSPFKLTFYVYLSTNIANCLSFRTFLRKYSLTCEKTNVGRNSPSAKDSVCFGGLLFPRKEDISVGCLVTFQIVVVFLRRKTAKLNLFWCGQKLAARQTRVESIEEQGSKLFFCVWKCRGNRRLLYGRNVVPFRTASTLLFVSFPIRRRRTHLPKAKPIGCYYTLLVLRFFSFPDSL